MRTTEAMKLWHSPESLFERETEVEGERGITQTKQSKTNYDAEFHIRYRGGKIVKDLPIFCEKWSSKQVKPKRFILWDSEFYFQWQITTNKAYSSIVTQIKKVIQLG